MNFPTDDDSLAVLLWLVSLFALILNMDGNFCCTRRRNCQGSDQNNDDEVSTFVLRV